MIKIDEVQGQNRRNHEINCFSVLGENEMNTEVKRASHTQKVPHIVLPRNPPVTKVNNVKKAPISVRSGREKKKGVFC